MGEERLPQRVVFGELIGGKGYSAGQEQDLMAHLKEDMSVFGMKFEGWRKAAQKAGRWFRRVEEGAELFMPNWHETERRKAAERRAKAAAAPSAVGISKRPGGGWGGRGKFIRLYLSGFTSGERNGTIGPDVGFNNEFDEGNDAIVWPSDTFRGWWGEGTPEKEFEDGVFSIYAVTALDAYANYTAVIDRSSGLKSSCGHPVSLCLPPHPRHIQANYSGFYAWVDDDTGYKEFGQQNFVIEETEAIPMDCYTAPASLTSHICYFLPYSIGECEMFKEERRALEEMRKLDGFTSGEGNGTSGGDFALGELVLAGNASWLGGWTEGTFGDGKPGFEDSYLLLRARETITAGEMHEVTVYRSNGIRAQCGMGENGTTSTIEVQSLSYPPWNSSDAFTFTQAVGSGCQELSYCSERGECDYCLQTCSCTDGFGSDAEAVERNVAKDCSERSCPAGLSWAPVLGGYPRPDPEASHTYAECSNMGVCDRWYGVCVCAAGFEGRACERYACPNGCSEHGVCRNMRDLGLMQGATPLLDNTSASSTSAQEGFQVAYGWDSPAGTAAWDSRSVFGCVCDAPWEYFGADCSLLHCPSGDDPGKNRREGGTWGGGGEGEGGGGGRGEARGGGGGEGGGEGGGGGGGRGDGEGGGGGGMQTEDDETDCFNKTAEGGRGVGAAGNK
eukprot:jgi/Undpi1/4574/HiC_scaffold_18.g07928.m1